MSKDVLKDRTIRAGVAVKETLPLDTGFVLVTVNLHTKNPDIAFCSAFDRADTLRVLKVLVHQMESDLN